MTKREVEIYLKEQKLFHKFTTKKIGQGNNSDIFLVTVGRDKYTLRAQRKDSLHQNQLLNQYINLKFLEAEKIDFAPRAVHYDKKEKILIATYAPGKDIIQRGLKTNELKQLAKFIVKLNSLSLARYRQVCKQNGLKVSEPETPLQSIKKYGTRKFNYIKKDCPDEKMVSWIKVRLDENIKYLKSVKWNKKHIGYNHGDLTGANILVNRGKIYIIDWDRARFVYSLDYGLGYMTLHFEFFEEVQERLIKYISQFSKRSEKTIRQAVEKSQQGTKVNDVIWSAQMYSELYKKKTRGWKKYRLMTLRRMREYKQMFEN